MEETQSLPKRQKTEKKNYFFEDFHKEKECGITEYLGSGKAWNGILKQRYEDFLVNEVDLQGNVVHLTDMETIPQDKEEESEKEEQEIDLSSIIGEATYKQIEAFVNEGDQSKTFTLDAVEDKEKRTAIHKGIRQTWSNIDSTTENKKIIILFKGSKSHRGPKRTSAWPKNRGNYLHFVLYKENKDTTEAISLLAKMTNSKIRTFQYAGTKDKRAVTVQKVSANRISAERAKKLNEKLFGIKLGNFSYEKNQLQLGDLKGNHFTIVIRNVDAEDDVIHASCNQLQHGFINYFGLQRFGTGSISTYKVGIELLKSNFSEAANLILCPREGESEESLKARKHYVETGNIEETLKLMPKQLHIERLLLQGFAKYGKNQFINSFSMIPRNMRILYIHSYQSYVWNHMVSERLQLYGDQPVVGDLVLEGQESEECLLEEDEMETSQSRDSKSEVEVKVLTEEDIKSSKYTIHDVVLPLPGHSVVYPHHKIGEKYKEFMNKDEITNEHFKHRIREFSLAGNYRKVIQKIEQLKWEILHYNDHTISLSLSDYDILQNKKIETVEDGKYKALKLSFILSGACYATMLFRQLLRTSTSSGYQKALSDAFIKSRNEEKEQEEKKE